MESILYTGATNDYDDIFSMAELGHCTQYAGRIHPYQRHSDIWHVSNTLRLLSVPKKAGILRRVLLIFASLASGVVPLFPVVQERTVGRSPANIETHRQPPEFPRQTAQPKSGYRLVREKHCPGRSSGST